MLINIENATVCYGMEVCNGLAWYSRLLLEYTGTSTERDYAER